MQRRHLFDSLVFNRFQIFDECINPLACVNPFAIVDDRVDYLLFYSDAAFSQFMRMTLLIR